MTAPHSAARSFEPNTRKARPAANGKAADRDDAPPAIRWPSRICADALIGLAGDFVGLVAPQSEADPAALLIQFLVAFGNACGPSPYFMREADRHGVNLDAAVVGQTSKARKGTSWGQVRRVIGEADPQWADRIASGAASGEGLIYHVRDAKEETKTRPADPGETDKRLLLYESELAGLLKIASKQGNTLSPVIRIAWDGGKLRTLAKHHADIATGAHISIIGHITQDELRVHFSSTEAANGFGNRFLWVCAKRSQVLPEGGQLDRAAIDEMAVKTRAALEYARGAGEMRRDKKARELWARVYPALSEGQPGLLGCMIARSEAQVLRLAAIYALLNQSTTITEDDLRAALEIWRYCEDSARFLFSERLGDPTADVIVSALREAPNGLTRSDISGLFNRNKGVDEINRALAGMENRGMAARSSSGGHRGRAPERWVLRG